MPLQTFATELSCLCGRTFPLHADVFLCPSCGRSLEIEYDYAKMKRAGFEALRKRLLNHARYMEFYPVKSIVSMQEGGTPLLKSRSIGPKLGLDLWFKMESANPTGSFKDRGSSVEVARALGYGAKNVVCASTGNMGASVAAYSAIAGLHCFIFVSKAATHIKMEQILAYGAKVFHIGSGYTGVMHLAERVAARRDFFLLGDYLWRREGTKSVGFEIMEQAKPDWIFTPAGNGTLASATWKACREFKAVGLAKAAPKMAVVQAAGCSPLAKAWRTGRIEPQHNARTVAQAIECESPIDGERVLVAAKDSKGFVAAVTDAEILRAREALAEHEGIFTEPSGAVALAGLLRNTDKATKGERIVCIVTGHGLKAPCTPVHKKPVESGLKELDAAFARKGGRGAAV